MTGKRQQKMPLRKGAFKNSDQCFYLVITNLVFNICWFKET